MGEGDGNPLCLSQLEKKKKLAEYFSFQSMDLDRLNDPILASPSLSHVSLLWISAPLFLINSVIPLSHYRTFFFTCSHYFLIVPRLSDFPCSLPSLN